MAMNKYWCYIEKSTDDSLVAYRDRAEALEMLRGNLNRSAVNLFIDE